LTSHRSRLDRRAFLKSCTALGLGSLAGEGALAAAPPSLAIARYRQSPSAPDGVAEEARRLTRQAVEALGGMARFVSKGDKVLVKPNIGWDRRPEQAADTNPDVVAALVEMCYQAGAKKVIVTDNSTQVAERAFARSGIQAAAEKAGAEAYFVDQRKFRKMAVRGKALTEWEIYADAVEADKLINVPIVKHHGLCRATLGLKNLMGLIGGPRNRLHQDLDRSLPDLAAFFKPTLVVVDAVRVLTANGPTGGNLADVQRKDTVAASVDQVAADAFAATLLGLRPQDVRHVVEAAARGLGKLDFESLAPKRVDV
jgi:uncharacterized protein (DUF362 family)